MSYNYQRINAWIDEQPLIENADIGYNVWHEMNGRYHMIPMDDPDAETASSASYPENEYNLDELLEQLETKKLTPLITTYEEVSPVTQSNLIPINTLSSTKKQKSRSCQAPAEPCDLQKSHITSTPALSTPDTRRD